MAYKTASKFRQGFKERNGGNLGTGSYQGIKGKKSRKQIPKVKKASKKRQSQIFYPTETLVIESPKLSRTKKEEKVRQSVARIIREMIPAYQLPKKTPPTEPPKSTEPFNTAMRDKLFKVVKLVKK